LLGCPLSTKKFCWSNSGSEGLRKTCGSGAWMQQSYCYCWPSPLPFNCKSAKQLILRGLCSAVGVPTPKLVIANAANPGGKACKPGLLAMPKGLIHGFSKQDCSKGINCK
jgi:hypothetical protein